MRPRLAVDPEAVLDVELAAAAAELPDRAAAQPEQGALAVGGPGHLDRRARGGSAPRTAPPRPRRRLPVEISRSSPASWRPSRGQVEPALVDQAEAAGIAVMAGLDPADAGGVVARPARPRRRPCRASRPRGSRSNCGRRASASNGRRWCASAWTELGGSAPLASPAPPQLTISRFGPSLSSKARVEAQAPASARGGGGGAASKTSTLVLRLQPLIAPAPRLAERPDPQPGALDRGGDPAAARHIAALPARQRLVAERHREQGADRRAAKASVSHSGTSRRAAA